MSLETWKKEFYSQDPTKRMTKVAAVKHSIKKWVGLRPENLKKHKLSYFDVKGLQDVDGNKFWVNSSSCALCVKYYDDQQDKNSCYRCPLYKSLGNIECDGSDDMPFMLFVDNKNDPEPMIAALEKVLAEIENESTR